MDTAPNPLKRSKSESEGEGSNGNGNSGEDVGSSVVDEAISITLVASEIFQYLSHRDLLNCSLVNKVWNTSARFTLREDRRSCVRLGGRRGKFPCEELTLLSEVISTAWSHPFNGFFFTFSETNQCHSSRDRPVCTSLSSACVLIQKLLAAIKIKYLGLSLHRKPNLACPVAAFMADIVKTDDLSQNIVELIIERLPDVTLVQDFFANFKSDDIKSGDIESGDIKSGDIESGDITSGDVTSGDTGDADIKISFPNVKELMLPLQTPAWGNNAPVNKILKQLLDATPQIERLKGYIPFDIMQTVAKYPGCKNWIVHDFSFDISVCFENRAMDAKESENPDEEDLIYDTDKLLDMALAFVQQPRKIKIRNMRVLIDSIIEYYQVIGPYDDNEGGNDYDEYDTRDLKSKAIKVATSVLQRASDFIRQLRIFSLDLTTILVNQFGELKDPMEEKLKLRELTHLIIEAHDVTEALDSLRHLSLYGFQQFCPRLKVVEIYCGRQFAFPKLLVFNNGHARFPSTNSNQYSSTVTTLKVGGDFTRFGSAATVSVKDMILNFARIFPNVKSFTFDMTLCSQIEECLVALWTAWPDLENLSLDNIADFTIPPNLDHVFTGLTRKEIDRYFRPWKVWDEERFTKLQVAPSLLDLKQLKTLEIKIKHNTNCFKTNGLDKNFLSKLTGSLVFGRMPQLQVYIFRNCCDSRVSVPNAETPVCSLRLSQLQPFVQLNQL